MVGRGVNGIGDVVCECECVCICVCICVRVCVYYIIDPFTIIYHII